MSGRELAFWFWMSAFALAQWHAGKTCGRHGLRSVATWNWVAVAVLAFVFAMERVRWTP